MQKARVGLIAISLIALTGAFPSVAEGGYIPHFFPGSLRGMICETEIPDAGPALTSSLRAAGLDLFNLVMEGSGAEPSPVDFLPSLSPLSMKIEVHRISIGSFKTGKLENTLFTSSLLTLAALNVGDFFSTREALKIEGIHEWNPLMKPFVKNDLAFAAVKVGYTAFSTWCLKSIYKKDKRLGWVLSTLSNLAMSYVVYHNLDIIHKSRIAAR